MWLASSTRTRHQLTDRRSKAPIRSRPTACSVCQRLRGKPKSRQGAAPRWQLLEERRLDPHRSAIGANQRTTDFHISPTDPDATPMRTGTETSLGYHDHYLVDEGKQRIILAALVTLADVMENVPLRDLLWRVCFPAGYGLAK